MKAANMISKKGNKVPNQFIIHSDDGRVVYFQSYQSVIARKDENGVTLDRNYWDYSRTTAKYRNLFLNKTTEEIKKLIKEGVYKFDDLNKALY